jgi:hypothetical protein
MGRIAMYSSALGAAYTNYGGEIRSYSGAGIDVSDLRFYTANGAATAERMRIDNAGNVGIGVVPSASTTFPALEIGAGNCILGASGFVDYTMNAYYNGSYRYKANGAASYYEQTGGSHLWYNAASGTAGNAISFTERMRIDSSGNVGIGTSSPAQRLDVQSGATANTVNISSISLATYNPSAYNGASARVFMRGGNSVGTFTGTQFTHGGNFEAFFGAVQNAANTADFVFQGYSGSVYEERMRINASGNVGIGTSTPAARLTVSLAAGSVAAGQLIVKDPSYSGVALVQGGSGEGYLWNTSNNFLSIATNNTERMRIDSSGNVLVGTTGNGLSAKMVVETTTNAANAVFSMTRNGAFDNVTFYHQYAYNSNAAVQCRFLNTNAVSIGSITSSGTATAFNTSSDYRLKDIDGPITNSGVYIDALKPVQGSWKADGSRFIGLLAHEVQEVSETPIATGEKDGEEMQAMDYSAPELIANLIAEIQSMRARLAQLEGN